MKLVTFGEVGLISFDHVGTITVDVEKVLHLRHVDNDITFGADITELTFENSKKVYVEGNIERVIESFGMAE